MEKIIYWLLDLLMKKLLADNLGSFKLDLKRLKPRVRAWGIKHNRFIAWVFYVGDRGYSISLLMTISFLMVVTANKCFAQPNNNLALPLFGCVSVIALALFTFIMFAPMQPKPERKR